MPRPYNYKANMDKRFLLIIFLLMFFSCGAPNPFAYEYLCQSDDDCSKGFKCDPVEKICVKEAVFEVKDIDITADIPGGDDIEGDEFAIDGEELEIAQDVPDDGMDLKDDGLDLPDDGFKETEAETVMPEVIKIVGGTVSAASGFTYSDQYQMIFRNTFCSVPDGKTVMESEHFKIYK
jgi:hypothetical protein